MRENIQIVKENIQQKWLKHLDNIYLEQYHSFFTQS